MSWTKRWFATCGGCPAEASCSEYYAVPEGWLRGQYGKLACPACAPDLRSAEVEANILNAEAMAKTQEAYAPAYEAQRAWDETHPKPQLPAHLKHHDFLKFEVMIRKVTCPGCGCSEQTEGTLLQVPHKPKGWGYAGKKRGAGAFLCPSCLSTLGENYYADLVAWRDARDAEVGDLFREAYKNTVRSVSPKYPKSWK
jgi:hypothetical protein